MYIRETSLDGARLLEPAASHDARGSFMRTFCARTFAEHGLETGFVQHSLSHSLKKGTLRGMHYQEAPHGEVKLVSCVRGAILDVIVDLRPASATYLQWCSFELTQDNRRQLYVPKGFAHGFLTLCDDVLVNYLISEFYHPPSARGLRYDDPVLDIVWPEAPAIISDKDLNWPSLIPVSS